MKNNTELQIILPKKQDKKTGSKQEKSWSKQEKKCESESN